MITPDGNKFELGKSTAGQVEPMGMLTNRCKSIHFDRKAVKADGCYYISWMLSIHYYSLVLSEFYLFYRHFANCMALAF